MRTGRAALAALLLAGAAGCAPAAPARPAPPSFPPLPDPVTACTGQVAYWAGEELRAPPDQGFDYQEMGLTSGQYDALPGIVARARAEGAEVIPGLARQVCEQLATQPSSGPWGY